MIRFDCRVMIEEIWLIIFSDCLRFSLALEGLVD
jgi:hypothetical protein